MYLKFAIIFLLGVAFGALIINRVRFLIDPPAGNWRINTDDPEKDIFSIEFSRHPSLLYNRKYVTFNVVHEKNISYNGGVKNEKN